MEIETRTGFPILGIQSSNEPGGCCKAIAVAPSSNTTLRNAPRPATWRGKAVKITNSVGVMRVRAPQGPQPVFACSRYNPHTPVTPQQTIGHYRITTKL